MTYQAIREVLQRPAYAILALVVSVAIFVATLLLPNAELVGMILNSSSAGVLEKAGVIASLIGSIATNFTPYSASVLTLIAVMSGINLAMSAYLFRTKAGGVRQSALGILGFGTGAIGIGCSACGSVVLTAFVGSALTFLPFAGAEFGIIGIALLAISIRALGRKILKPLVCEIN